MVKKLFNEGKISKRLVYKSLTLISNNYIDNFNAREFERFLLDPTYSTKEHILFPSNNGFLTKFLTFLLLIQIYIYVPKKTIVEKLLEKEIIKILIHIHQNKTEEEEILDFFKVLNISLNRLGTERFFTKRVLSKKYMNLANNEQTYLLADFFIDYLIRGKRPNISISELKNRLAELESNLNYKLK